MYIKFRTLLIKVKKKFYRNCLKWRFQENILVPSTRYFAFHGCQIKTLFICLDK